MDYSELFNTEIRKEQLAKRHAEGKTQLGIVCCHVPFELLHAAGVCPIRIRATSTPDSGAADAMFPPKSCSFARTVFQNLADKTYDLDGDYCFGFRILGDEERIYNFVNGELTLV